MRAALAVAAILIAVPAAAQDRRVWTPAPTSGAGTTSVAPADRAGRSTGPDNASPFSGLPSGAATGSGQSSPTTRDNVGNLESGTPSVSR